MKNIGTLAVVAALFASQATFAQAPGTPGTPGTAGAGNAAAASPGGVTPTQPGTGPGQTNPGNINVPLPSEPSPPAANPNRVPTGGHVQSTTPPGNQQPASAGGGTVGQSRRATQLQDPKEDPTVWQSEQEVSKRIKSICKGC